MKIVICEDNVMIAMDLEMIVEDLGHTDVGHATRSDTCLAMCREVEPDLVLVDVDLVDGPTGPDLTKRLAEMGIPSVIVSGQTNGLSPDDHAAGALLQKPFVESDLAGAIDHLEAASS
jgi:CheY-like chemotaxis protein